MKEVLRSRTRGLSFYPRDKEGVRSHFVAVFLQTVTDAEFDVLSNCALLLQIRQS